MKFIDHYAKGLNAAVKLPKRFQEFPTIYTEQWTATARKYGARYEDSNEASGEFLHGLEDALYKLAEHGQRYAVFAWTAAGRYPAESAFGPICKSASIARQWMHANISENEILTGGPEHRGFVIRPTYISNRKD